MLLIIHSIPTTHSSSLCYCHRSGTCLAATLPSLVIPLFESGCFTHVTTDCRVRSQTFHHSILSWPATWHFHRHSRSSWWSYSPCYFLVLLIRYSVCLAHQTTVSSFYFIELIHPSSLHASSYLLVLRLSLWGLLSLILGHLFTGIVGVLLLSSIRQNLIWWTWFFRAWVILFR